MKLNIYFSNKIKNETVGYDTCILVRGAIRSTLLCEGCDGDYEVSVTFCDDEYIKKLNSKYRKIIAQLNDTPVLAVRPVSSPFKKRWMNIILLLILPVSLLVYIRSIRFRTKLLIDITKVEIKTREIVRIIKREKLININQ